MSANDGGMTLRTPAVAGQFYPQDPAELREAIRQAYLSLLGPGTEPEVMVGPRKLIGVVAPHAGYPYSAQGAAWSYAAVAADGRPELVVLLGVNHRGLGAPLAISSADGWQTPLGVIPLHHEARQRLLELDPQLTLDERAHATEHSLEVQIPFIQALFGEIAIIPIVLGHVTQEMLQPFAHALAELARSYDVLFVASSDLSHYIPFRDAEVLDHLALQAIAAVDAPGLLEVVGRRDISMCGVMPVTAMLLAARELGVTSGKILHYHTSGDVTGDKQEVVGYGAASLAR